MEFTIHTDAGFRGPKTAVIKAPDQRTDAYHVNWKGSSDVDTRRGGPSGTLIGRVNFHTFSQTVDIEFENSQSSKLTNAGVFSRALTLPLPAASKKSQFYWKIDGIFSGWKKAQARRRGWDSCCDIYEWGYEA